MVRQPLLVEHDTAIDEVAEQRVGHCLGLFGDLLEHEVLIAALFGGRHVPVDVKMPSIRVIRLAVEIGDAVAVGGDHDRLVLAEFDGVAGVFDERCDIGADKHLTGADADNERRGAPDSDDGARLVGVGEDQRVVALEAAHHGQHGGDEVARGVTALVLAGDQVDDASVSVSLASFTPAASNSARSAAKFSMIPLCTTAILTAASLCGCALRSVGRPCVAQRVWPTPAWPLRVAASVASRAASRLASRPARRRTVRVPRPLTRATPAES